MSVIRKVKIEAREGTEVTAPQGRKMQKVIPIGERPMLEWALTDLMDEQACYDYLLQALHPDGLHCPKASPVVVPTG